MLILCLGKSFTGNHLANRCKPDEIVFASRQPGQKYDLQHQEVDNLYDYPDWIIDTLPAVFKSDNVFGHPYRKLVESILEKKPSAKFLHISSTSVLGHTEVVSATQDDAPELDEDDDPIPDSNRGEKRLLWEMGIKNWIPQAFILRSTGIYGPGRNILASIKQCKVDLKDQPNRIVSRIHIEDLTSLILAILKREDSDIKLLHAVDQKPTSNDTLFRFLQENIQYDFSAYRFGQSILGRKIRSKYREDFLEKLKHPNFKSGYLSIYSS